ncbi:hypothetical protein CHY_2521 [Carboxydothermus hydrogenoformans Z-2901]|uniref:Uncharacterized protein n=1 Tax=Carboxydothermus hydrogenoformans (strain ATCC BAA-161 / DSM 6008 / Z-2901) TaxID=246194 RepID=Q3A970_CARHZ|nr:hypothetical protein CHY_2521 [Carboxydothermus hydrogenoformans Z-2901]
MALNLPPHGKKVIVMTFSVMLPEVSFTCTLIGLGPSDSVTIMLTSAFFVPTAMTLPAMRLRFQSIAIF